MLRYHRGIDFHYQPAYITNTLRKTERNSSAFAQEFMVQEISLFSLTYRSEPTLVVRYVELTDEKVKSLLT